MRTKITPLLGALLAVLAVSAVASASASAATCKIGERGAEHHTLCIEGKQVGTPSKTVSTSYQLQQKTATSVVFNDAAQEWKVTCATLHTEKGSVIESAGEGSVKLAKFKLELGKCEALIKGKAEPACSVAAIPNPSTGTFLSPIEDLRIASTLTNNEFMEIKISGGCVLSGDWWVYGSDKCSVKQAEVETASKELICEAKNSEMELKHGQGSNVTFAVEANFELTGESKGKKFSFIN